MEQSTFLETWSNAPPFENHGARGASGLLHVCVKVDCSMVSKRRSTTPRLRKGRALLYVFEKEEHCSTFTKRRSIAPCFRKGGLLHGFQKEEHCSRFTKRRSIAPCFRKGGLLHVFEKEEQRSMVFKKSVDATV
jgi:hypothetical protein